MITGKLRIMGRIDVVEEDQPTGQFEYGRALLIEFDSTEDIRQALEDEACRFTLGEPDSAAPPMKFVVQELRPEVLAFALLMEQRLRDKDETKGKSWKDMDIDNLRVCAVVKCYQAEQEIHKGDMTATARSVVDLANYAMMIADVAGALEQPVNEITERPDWHEIEARGEAQA